METTDRTNPKRIIFNADDLGYTKGITDGIIHGVKNGVIRSATILVNGEDAPRAAQLSKEYPQLAVGLHLNLTLGNALTNGKTIAREDGSFYSLKERKEQVLDPEEVEAEFEAQIQKFQELFGTLPSHLDSHHGMHDFQNNLTVTKKLAEKYGLPMRRYSDFRFIRSFFGSEEVEDLIRILEAEEGDLEIMCHPGFCDERLKQLSRVAEQRERELAILCSSSLQEWMECHHMETVSYSQQKRI